MGGFTGQEKVGLVAVKILSEMSLWQRSWEVQGFCDQEGPVPGEPFFLLWQE